MAPALGPAGAIQDPVQQVVRAVEKIVGTSLPSVQNICNGTVARGNGKDSSADAKPEAWSAVHQKNFYSQRLLATEDSDYYLEET